jgi:hypothetical protein
MARSSVYRSGKAGPEVELVLGGVVDRLDAIDSW